MNFAGVCWNDGVIAPPPNEPKPPAGTVEPSAREPNGDAAAGSLLAATAAVAAPKLKGVAVPKAWAGPRAGVKDAGTGTDCAWETGGNLAANGVCGVLDCACWVDSDAVRSRSCRCAASGCAL